MNKAPITTHILDLHRGKPAEGVLVQLCGPASGTVLTAAKTDQDGRILNWPDSFTINRGVWTLRFSVHDWFEEQRRNSFFSDIELKFNIESLEDHYHVPLLLNEFGYSTYRGS